MDPENLKYSPTHEWYAIEGDIITIGVTRQALKSLGSLIAIELPEVGDDVLNDVPFGEIEGLRESVDLHSPADGAAVEVNHQAASDPDILEKDPYGEGWLIRIKQEAGSLRQDLLSEAEYKALMRGRKRS